MGTQRQRDRSRDAFLPGVTLPLRAAGTQVLLVNASIVVVVVFSSGRLLNPQHSLINNNQWHWHKHETSLSKCEIFSPLSISFPHRVAPDDPKHLLVELRFYRPPWLFQPIDLLSPRRHWIQNEMRSRPPLTNCYRSREMSSNSMSYLDIIALVRLHVEPGHSSVKLWQGRRARTAQIEQVLEANSKKRTTTLSFQFNISLNSCVFRFSFSFSAHNLTHEFFDRMFQQALDFTCAVTLPLRRQRRRSTS